MKFNLAISLHDALNETRSRLMPINKTNSLEDLAESLKYWYKKTKRKVTYEYVVWKGINDTREHVQALVKFCKLIPCKVNLIEYNPIDDGPYQQASPEAVKMYQTPCMPMALLRAYVKAVAAILMQPADSWPINSDDSLCARYPSF